MAPPSFQDIWFDENFGRVLDYDVAAGTFSRSDFSLRLQSSRLRVLCLRQEDGAVFKEAGLRWLTGDPIVTLTVYNVGRAKPGGVDYANPVATFVAPEHWLRGM